MLAKYGKRNLQNTAKETDNSKQANCAAEGKRLKDRQGESGAKREVASHHFAKAFNSSGSQTRYEESCIHVLPAEAYFRWKFTEETTYTRMGGWWDRKGENEIDIVCEDEINRRIDFYEVKRDAEKREDEAKRDLGENYIAGGPLSSVG